MDDPDWLPALLRMGDFKQLKVWQKAQAVALESHRLSQAIRGSDYSSLRSQIIRAGFSVPANIVEGNGVQSHREYSRFVRIALNSANELEYHLLTARDLRLISETKAVTVIANVIEVRKMLHGLLRYLATRSSSETARPPKQKSEM